jgi:hypothetical protein
MKIKNEFKYFIFHNNSIIQLYIFIQINTMRHFNSLASY